MSGEASTLLLEHHLKVLKLPTFVRDYKSVAAVCAQERCVRFYCCFGLVKKGA